MEAPFEARARIHSHQKTQEEFKEMKEKEESTRDKRKAEVYKSGACKVQKGASTT